MSGKCSVFQTASLFAPTGSVILGYIGTDVTSLWQVLGGWGDLGSHSPSEFLLVPAVGLHLGPELVSAEVKMDLSVFGALCWHSLLKSIRAANYLWS